MLATISGRGTEVSKELRKRKVDVYCLQEVRWRGEGARMFGVKGKKVQTMMVWKR